MQLGIKNCRITITYIFQSEIRLLSRSYLDILYDKDQCTKTKFDSLDLITKCIFFFLLTCRQLRIRAWRNQGLVAETAHVRCRLIYSLC